ncbi:MAG: FkbM family methyltransferase [Planctomycetes bacterium]|nr:FkbM family methyltransferase [Planctomycetota bacterium]
MTRTTRLVRSPALGIEFEVLEGDAFIGPAIERGAWEEHETALFRAHLAPGTRVLDLGANVGWFGALAVLAGCEVHCFEPVPAIADVCARNLARAMAAGTGRGVLHRVAASDRAGKARIALARANFGDNRVLDASAAAPADMRGAETLEIELARVDDLVQGPVRVIKIDTQGSEWLALQGAEQLLDASPRCALLLEFWPYALRGAKPEELLAFLAERSFTLGKATAAPYPMQPARILKQALARDPVKGGLDLYGTRGVPFHVLGLSSRLRALARSFRED